MDASASINTGDFFKITFNSIFISPTNAQPICFKILKFTLKYTVNSPTYFGLTKPSSGNLQSVLR
jgi:hypothetical protein